MSPGAPANVCRMCVTRLIELRIPCISLDALLRKCVMWAWHSHGTVADAYCFVVFIQRFEKEHHHAN